VTASYRYDVFGAIRSQTGSSGNEFKFAGEQVDPSGMQFLRSRYYDMGSGRFASRDPLSVGDPYSYVGNNPTLFVDPAGECRIEVRAKSLGRLSLIDLHGVPSFGKTFYHLYIVAYDPDGSTRAYRADSGGLFGGGELDALVRPYGPGHPDWDDDGDHKAHALPGIGDKESCDPWRSSFDHLSDEIQGAELPYSLLGRNSNSYVYTLLLAAGLPVEKPGGWAPGWGNDLRDDVAYCNSPQAIGRC